MVSASHIYTTEKKRERPRQHRAEGVTAGETAKCVLVRLHHNPDQGAALVAPTTRQFHRTIQPNRRTHDATILHCPICVRGASVVRVAHHAA